MIFQKGIVESRLVQFVDAVNNIAVWTLLYLRQKTNNFKFTDRLNQN